LPAGAVCRTFGRRRLFNRIGLKKWVAEAAQKKRPDQRGDRTASRKPVDMILAEKATNRQQDVMQARRA
jgi:hypothetical protein